MTKRGLQINEKKKIAEKLLRYEVKKLKKNAPEKLCKHKL